MIAQSEHRCSERVSGRAARGLGFQKDDLRTLAHYAHWRSPLRSGEEKREKLRGSSCGRSLPAYYGWCSPFHLSKISSINSAARQNLRREAEQRGIAGARIIFAPRMKLPDHLARHRLADLFLDTLPHNAHTTTSDALWAGLPVLTCRGTTFAGRVAASLLQAIGLPDLVTRS